MGRWPPSIICQDDQADRIMKYYVMLNWSASVTLCQYAARLGHLFQGVRPPPPPPPPPTHPPAAPARPLSHSRAPLRCRSWASSFFFSAPPPPPPHHTHPPPIMQWMHWSAGLALFKSASEASGRWGDWHWHGHNVVITFWRHMYTYSACDKTAWITESIMIQSS